MNSDSTPPQATPPRSTSARSPGVPSRRVVGALLVAALAAGVVAGASLAPAPASSLASGSTIVQRLLALLAAQGAGTTKNEVPRARTHARASHATAQTTPTQTTTAASTSQAGAGGNPASEATEGGPSGSGGGGRGGEAGESQKQPVRLPPISHVWLVVISGGGFSQAGAAPASYPYLTGQLLKTGTLLERYSAIEAYELAGDAALLTGGIGESVSTISESCPASAPGAGSPAGAPTSAGAGGCATGAPTASGQAEADLFLQRVVAPILASSAYGERGLIVVTFGSASQEQGSGATTLASQPPAGALLISPTLKVGGHSGEAFNSLAPRQSLEAIFAAS